MFPIGRLWFSFEVHVDYAYVISLLCTDDMDQPGLFLNILRKILSHPGSRRNGMVTRINEHAFVQWNARHLCMLTSVEIC